MTFRNNYLFVLCFALLHALCCYTCHALGTDDSFVLTLLTISMVFILCLVRKKKVTSTVAITIIVIVLAFISGHAIPRLLVHLTGETIWTNVVSTFITTMALGAGLEHILSKTSVSEYKKKWVVHFNDRIVPVTTEQIAYFISKDKYNYLVTNDGYNYIIDTTIDSIVKDLDPTVFYRINRGCIVSMSCIKAVVRDSGRYIVEVVPKSEDQIIITKARVDDFLGWLA